MRRTIAALARGWSCGTSARRRQTRVALLRKRYPSAVFYSSKRGMLRRHRLSRLDSYRRVPFLETRLASLRFPFWRSDGPRSTRDGSILTTLVLLLCWGLMVVMIPVVLVWSL